MPDTHSVSRRLRLYIAAKSLSARRFEALCGLANGYTRTAKSVGTDKLQAIKRACPDININWLVLGVGPMLEPFAGAATAQGAAAMLSDAAAGALADPCHAATGAEHTGDTVGGAAVGAASADARTVSGFAGCTVPGTHGDIAGALLSDTLQALTSQLAVKDLQINSLQSQLDRLLSLLELSQTHRAGTIEPTEPTE